jgi:hypothetical protein
MVNARIRGATSAARAAGPLLLWALLLAACNEEFQPQYLVTDFRVLAIRAEVVGSEPLADGDTGDTVRLEALLANPQGLSPVSVRWKACLPVPGQAVPPCLDSTYLSDPARLEGAPGVLDLGTGLAVQVPVPPELAPALAALVDRAVAEPVYACTLYAQVPVVAIATAGSQQRVALKGARLTPWREVAGTPLAGAYVPNRNPSLEAVVADPASRDSCDGGTPTARACLTTADCGGLSCLPDPAGGPGQCDDPRPVAGGTLCARQAAGAIQAFFQCRPDGSRVELAEELDYQWYVTGGSFDGPTVEPVSGTGNVTDRAVTFWPPVAPFTMWVIVRDGRGGSGWLRRDFP